MPDCSVSIGCWKKQGADRQGCRRLTGLAGEAPVLREDEKRRRTVAVGCQASLFLTAVFPEREKLRILAYDKGSPERAAFICYRREIYEEIFFCVLLAHL